MNVTPIKPQASAPKQVIPSLSVETGMIVDHILRNRESSQTITFEALSALIGRDILANRGFLYSARRILFRDHGVYVESVRGVGVKVGTNEAVLEAGIRDVGTSRRAIRRASRKFEAVQYEDLPEDRKKDYVGHVSAVNTLRLLTTPNAVRKIAAAGAGEPLPSATVLDLFRK
jgi:hypothetical protein